MTTSSSRTLRRVLIAGGIAGLAISATGIAPAVASSGHHSGFSKQAPVAAGGRYLALGDSVPFGYIEDNAITAHNYAKQKKFVGFPEDVAKNLGLRLTNAACPGETTGSFIDVSAQSNGCTNTVDVGNPPAAGGYRADYPLHTTYKSSKQSQLAFAEAYLKAHPKTQLVTLMIGANDGFICLATSTDGCASEFASLFTTIKANAKTIFKGLRETAGYTGQIVVVTYFSLDYTNGLDNIQSQQISQAVTDAGKKYKIEIADGYDMFQSAAQQAGGDTCAAQLLTALTGADAGTCGVHPSLAGQALLAQAVEQAVTK